MEQIKIIIDKIADAEIFRVQLTGGEPFLHPDLFEIISYISEKGLFCHLVTNGTLVGEEEVTRLKQLGVYSVQVSLCGSTPELHDSLTGVEGSYEATVNTIRELVRQRVGTYVNMTVIKKNYEDVANTARVATKLGINNFTVTRFVPVEGLNTKELGLGQEEMYQVLDQLSQLELGGVSSHQLISFPYCIFPDPEKLVGRVGKCGGGFYWMCISPDGTVRPCTCLPHQAGNISELSVEEIWNSSFFKEIRNLTYIPVECHLCKYGAFCMGGCRAASYFEKNDISAADPLYSPRL